MKKIILSILIINISLFAQDYFKQAGKAFEKKQFNKGIELLTKACYKENIGVACNIVATYYEDQLKNIEDRMLYESMLFANSSGLTKGLSNGIIMSSNLQAKQARSNALLFYKKACRLKVKEACDKYEVLLAY